VKNWCYEFFTNELFPKLVKQGFPLNIFLNASFLKNWVVIGQSKILRKLTKNLRKVLAKTANLTPIFLGKDVLGKSAFGKNLFGKTLRYSNY